jgi:hypothetical protein
MDVGGNVLPITAPGRSMTAFGASPVAPRPREGPLTEPTAVAQPWRRERVLMPLSSHSPHPRSIGKKVVTTVTEGPRSSRDTLSGNEEVLSCLCIYPSAVGADATRPELWAVLLSATCAAPPSQNALH